VPGFVDEKSNVRSAAESKAAHAASINNAVGRIMSMRA